MILSIKLFIKYNRVSYRGIKAILWSWQSKRLACLLLCGLLMYANAQSQTIQSQAVQSQTVQSLTDTDITLYTADTKSEISKISKTSNYKIIERTDNWSLVRFNQPTVPVWVSQNYLRFDETNRATVTASDLNIRMRPSLDAKVLSRVNQGYTSEVLAFSDGFAQIKAPSTLVVAISVLENTDSQVALNKSTLRALNEKPLRALDQNALNAEEKPSVETTGITSKLAVPNEHILVPGDAISVVVSGEPDLNLSNARIPENGQISFPSIGYMSVAGLTTRNIERQLRTKYAQGDVKNPQLSVSIFSYKPIFIRGGVRNIGAFPYSEGLTVAKAIALAGGTKSTANPYGISILRDGETVKSELALDSLDQILSGDIITVAEKQVMSDDPAAFIYLHGEVNLVGEYSYRKNLTVEKAIVLAGGFSIKASPRKVSVTRYTEGEENPQIFNRVKMFFPIQPGDVIKVGERLF